MTIVFKTEEVGFYVKFNGCFAALEVIHRLPLNSSVFKRGDKICFEADIPVSPENSLTMDVQRGDVVYSSKDKCICVLLGNSADKPAFAEPVVIIGHTMANIEELREIESGEPIQLFKLGNIQDCPENGKVEDDNRKLNQEEIDVLIQQLLDKIKDNG